MSDKMKRERESMVRLLSDPTFGMFSDEELANFVVGEDDQRERNGTQPPQRPRNRGGVQNERDEPEWETYCKRSRKIARLRPGT